MIVVAQTAIDCFRAGCLGYTSCYVLLDELSRLGVRIGKHLQVVGLSHLLVIVSDCQQAYLLMYHTSLYHHAFPSQPAGEHIDVSCFNIFPAWPYQRETCREESHSEAVPSYTVTWVSIGVRDIYVPQACLTSPTSNRSALCLFKVYHCGVVTSFLLPCLMSLPVFL